LQRLLRLLRLLQVCAISGFQIVVLPFLGSKFGENVNEKEKRY
jgi:hypothetical protein